MRKQTGKASKPKLAVPTAKRAISLVKRRLPRKIKPAVCVSTAEFQPATFCWHLPVQLVCPDIGPIHIIGDVYLHAATGQFLGLPKAGELRCRALDRAKILGLIEEAEAL